MSRVQLGPPDIGEWTHIVATFETGVDSKVYRNDRYHHLVDSRVTNNGDGDPELSIGGLVNYGNHHIDACKANAFGCSVLPLDCRWRKDLLFTPTLFVRVYSYVHWQTSARLECTPGG